MSLAVMNPDFDRIMKHRRAAQKHNSSAKVWGLQLMFVPKQPNKYLPHYGAKEAAKYALRADPASSKVVQDILAPVSQPTKIDVKGKVIVFSGTFEGGTRAEAKAYAEGLGARVSGSVSGKTDILVYGPGAGSQKDKAVELGIRIMTEAEWLAATRA